MQALLNPTYFPAISHMVALNKYDAIFEVNDFYEKQTYRNRVYVFGPSGRQMMTVPVLHKSGQGKQTLKEVKIDNAVNWKKQHQKTLETAYRSSVYFEYYEYKLDALFSKNYTFLVDLNFETIDFIASCIDINFEVKELTDRYVAAPPNVLDLRHLSEAKCLEPQKFEAYYQLFSDKHGFISNLSTLDLIFNDSTNAKNYLDRHDVGF